MNDEGVANDCAIKEITRSLGELSQYGYEVEQEGDAY
jgi:hypothetical protein